jgi:uncharacterized membrane protein YhaH (DUF805 family)
MNWYLKVLRQYADFNGRARRKEYWMFVLFQIIMAIVAIMLDGALGTNFGVMPIGYIYMAYALLTLIPGIAVAVRRLHDTGKSGWFYFVNLIPLVGFIWFLVLMCKEGDRGENTYGPDPKSAPALV